MHNQTLKKIKIISINVNSIVKNQRRASLYNMMKTQKPDIILINETKLSKNHVLRFENYNVIRNDRKDSHLGGGTAAIIRKSFKYDTITLPETNKERILEQSIIKLNLKNNRKLYIIAAYAKCGNQKEFIPDLQKTFQLLKLNNEENYYIMAGDLNAKHTS